MAIHHKTGLDPKDLARIREIPIRPDRSMSEIMGIVGRVQNALSLNTLPGTCDCSKISPESTGCLDKLRPIQATSLYELAVMSGLIAQIGTGHGKTLIGILAPMVLLDCKVCLLLIPPTLVNQLILQYRLAEQHWRVPNLIVHGKGDWSRTSHKDRPVLHVLPYSLLCTKGYSDFIDRLRPDTIGADEVHKLGNVGTATGARVQRHFKERSETTRFFGWSATLMSKSISDFAHLSDWSLRENSPLPRSKRQVLAWANVLETSDDKHMGDLASGLESQHMSDVLAVSDRIRQTQGFVVSEGSSCDAALRFADLKIEVPKDIKDAVREVKNSWVRPDGEELVEAYEVARSCAQLSCGFYYRWTFPNGEDQELIERWLDVRSKYNKELREFMRPMKRFLDSPKLCEIAADRFHFPDIETSQGPQWESEFWEEWKDLKNKVKPVTKPVWMSSFFIEAVRGWAKTNTGVIWYLFESLGKRLSEDLGLPFHGGGPDAEKEILKEKGDRSIVASIASHGTGRDGLQWVFNKQLICNTPSSGKRWEQLLGRLHRPGQECAEVHVDIAMPIGIQSHHDAIFKAVKLSEYSSEIFNSESKLKQ